MASPNETFLSSRIWVWRLSERINYLYLVWYFTTFSEEPLGKSTFCDYFLYIHFFLSFFFIFTSAIVWLLTSFWFETWPGSIQGQLICVSPEKQTNLPPTDCGVQVCGRWLYPGYGRSSDIWLWRLFLMSHLCGQFCISRVSTLFNKARASVVTCRQIESTDRSLQNVCRMGCWGWGQVLTAQTDSTLLLFLDGG